MSLPYPDFSIRAGQNLPKRYAEHQYQHVLFEDEKHPSISYTIDKGQLWSINGTFLHSQLSGLSEGQHQLDVYAENNYSDSDYGSKTLRAHAVVYFVVDTSVPAVIGSPQNLTYLMDTVPLTFYLDKAASDISYSLDSAAKKPVRENITLTDLAQGSHVLCVFASAEGATVDSATVFFSVSTPNFTAPNSWQTLAPMLTARSGLGVAVVSGKIYAIGGVGVSSYFWLADNEEYDPVANRWVKKEHMPTSRQAFAIAASADKIYCIGGYGNGNKPNVTANEVYDPVSNSWETKAPMPVWLAPVDAHAVDGRIYVLGAALTEVYDPATDSWTNKTAMPHPTSEYTSVSVDGKIYVIGGEGNWTQIYNSKTDSWSQGKPIPITLDDAVAAATTGEYAPKRIYVFGGWRQGAIGPSSLNQVYDPEADSWSTAASFQHALKNSAATVVNDQLYALGGSALKSNGAGYYCTAYNQRFTPVGYGESQKSPTPPPTPSPLPSQTVPEFAPAAVIFVAVALCLVCLVLKRIQGRHFLS